MGWRVNIKKNNNMVNSIRYYLTQPRALGFMHYATTPFFVFVLWFVYLFFFTFKMSRVAQDVIELLIFLLLFPQVLWLHLCHHTCSYFHLRQRLASNSLCNPNRS